LLEKSRQDAGAINMALKQKRPGWSRGALINGILYTNGNAVKLENWGRKKR